jgi:hypothetical protein
MLRIQRIHRDFDYEDSRIGSDSHYTRGIKCKNYELCTIVLPTNWFDLFGNYLCSGCMRTIDQKEKEKEKSCLACSCSVTDKSQITH